MFRISPIVKFFIKSLLLWIEKLEKNMKNKQFVQVYPIKIHNIEYESHIYVYPLFKKNFVFYIKKYLGKQLSAVKRLKIPLLSNKRSLEGWRNIKKNIF